MSEYEVISIIFVAIGLVLTILAFAFPVNSIVSGSVSCEYRGTLKTEYC